MTVGDLKAMLANLDDNLEVVVPMTRDGEWEEEVVGDVVKRESMFGEGTVVAIVSERDL